MIFVQTRKRKEPSKKDVKKNYKNKKKNQKTASSPDQDLHPDWDRFRGTTLGELVMNKKQILRLYIEKEENILHGSSAQTFRGTLSGWTIKRFPYKKMLFDLITFRFRSIPMHVPNSRV